MSRSKHLIIFTFLLAKKILGNIRFFEKMFYRALQNIFVGFL